MTVAGYDDGRGGAAADGATAAADMMEQGRVGLSPRITCGRCDERRRRPKKRSSSSGLSRAWAIFIMVFCIVSLLIIAIGSIVPAIFSVMDLGTRISFIVIALASCGALVIVYLFGLYDMVLAVTE